MYHIIVINELTKVNFPKLIRLNFRIFGVIMFHY